MAKHFDELKIKGMDYRAFLSADPSDNPPTPAYCQQYAEDVGLDPAKVLIDPNFNGLFGNMDSGQAGGVGLPWDGVIDGRGMFYEWNATQGGTALSAVEKLLAK